MPKFSRVGLAVVGFLILHVSTVFAQITWVSNAPLPEVREGAAGAVAPGPDGLPKVYVMHGYSSGDTNNLRIYDPVADIWSAGPNSPGALSSEAYFGATADDGSGDLKTYIIGGRTTLTQNLKYNPITNIWATNAPMPTGRAGHGVAVVDNLIYAIGGRTGTTPFDPIPLNINQVYDPVADTWAALTPMPTARSGVGAVAVGGLIYVFGGWSLVGSTPTLQNLVEVYDPAADSWSTAAPMPTARAYLGATECGGKIYAIGGMISTTPVTSSMTNIVEVYDPATDAWTTETPMPTARAELVVVNVEGQVFAMGGGIFGSSLAANQSFTCQ